MFLGQPKLVSRIIAASETAGVTASPGSIASDCAYRSIAKSTSAGMSSRRSAEVAGRCTREPLMR
jgi:hypothetical protein